MHSPDIDARIGEQQDEEYSCYRRQICDYTSAAIDVTDIGNEFMLRNFSETYNSVVKIVRHTGKAILFETEKGNKYWLPVSILYKKKADNHKLILYVPDWCRVKLTKNDLLTTK
jgi:hypothetical protein